MSIIFEIGMMIFLLIILYRFTLFTKERKKQKMALENNYDERKAREYRFSGLFQIVMYSLWAIIFFYFFFTRFL